MDGTGPRGTDEGPLTSTTVDLNISASLHAARRYPSNQVAGIMSANPAMGPTQHFHTATKLRAVA
jgi:hypothetical protein